VKLSSSGADLFLPEHFVGKAQDKIPLGLGSPGYAGAVQGRLAADKHLETYRLVLQDNAKKKRAALGRSSGTSSQ
jgi:hypothetical protein